MDSAKLKVNAKNALEKNFRPLIMATAILMILEAACYFICCAMGKEWLASFLMIIVEALFLPGYIKMILNVSRNKSAKVEDLFSETESFFKYIFLMLIIGVIVGILFLLAAIDFKSLVSIIFYQSEISKSLAIFLIAFGLLLAAAITLVAAYIAISFSQALFILVDRKEFSVKQILIESFDMMETFMLEYFILAISFIGWILLSILTFGLLFIWVMPYILITLAYFYDIVKKDYEDYLKEQDKKEIKQEKPEEKKAVKKAPAKKAPAKKTSTTKKKTTPKKKTTTKTTK